MEYYTLSNETYSVKASRDFVMSCTVFTNMFEDTGGEDNSEDVPITDSFTESEFKMYMQFFEDMNALKVKNSAGEELSYLEYILNFREEYIKNYTNKNLDPPHINEVYQIFNTFGDENLTRIVEINKFYDNEKIIRGVMLCVAISIRKMDEPQNETETSEEYEKRTALVNDYIETILKCIS